jgi:predicted ArsR family transcriptional regulator
MKSALDPGDHEFLEQLQRRGAGTVQELCDDFGVTATAVRQRLGRLQSAELVERETVRAGRGRPHHRYRVAEAGRRLLGDNYDDLAVILWRELQSIEDPTVRQHIMGRVREALVQRYGQEVSTDVALRDRLEQLKGVLNRSGFSVEVDEDETVGLPILRETNCPYLELAERDPGICQLERSVFEQVLSASLTVTSRCLEGHGCCEFQASEAGGA